MFDEIHLRKIRAIENLRLPEVVIRFDRSDLGAAALHGLKHEQVLRDVFSNLVESEERMAEVVEHTHENHDIEFLAELRDVVDGKLTKFDVHSDDFCGETSLSQISRIVVDAE